MSYSQWRWRPWSLKDPLESRAFSAPRWSVTLRQPGDDLKEFRAAFKNAKNGCFVQELKLSRECLNDTLIHKMTVSEISPPAFQAGPSIVWLIPEITFADDSGLYDYIFLELDDGNISEEDLRNAFLNQNSELRIVKFWVSWLDPD